MENRIGIVRISQDFSGSKEFATLTGSRFKNVLEPRKASDLIAEKLFPGYFLFNFQESSEAICSLVFPCVWIPSF